MTACRHREITDDWIETRPLTTGLTRATAQPRYPRQHRRTTNGVLRYIDCCHREHDY
jgi:hypothetical protein